jgi:DNA modification methylase
MFNTARILVGDNRKTLATLKAGSVQTCITSPPYWGLRDYGENDQIGLEQTPDEYVEQLCLVFDEVWRVLADDGTLWLNLGDSYAGNNSRASNNGRAGFGNEREGVFTKTGDGLKTKDLVGIPWRVAFALQARGWYLRSEIIWHKPNPMPESVTDRPTKSHEHIFLLSKSAKYFYDHEAIKEDALTDPTLRNKNAEGYQADYASGDRFSPGERVFGADGKKNKRDVWSVPVQPFAGAHFAVYPLALIEPCVLAGSRDGDTILDPFSGSGTTGVVALRNGRNYVGTELNPQYAELSKKRISDDCGMFGEVEIEHI